MKTQDEIREDRNQNKKRMGAIQAFFDKLKPVKGVAMTQEEYAAYKGRDVSGPDEPGPDVTDGMVNNEGMDNDESVDNDISQTNNNQPRQSMDEYKEEWVERFVQTKSVGERQHLMDELQKRKALHEHEEAFVEDFVNERDPDKREVLVNNLREKQSAYDESVSQSTYSPDSIYLSSDDIADLSTSEQSHQL